MHIVTITSTPAAELVAIVVADGEQVHAVERPGKKQAHENQTQRRDERIGDHPAQTLAQESRRDSEYGFRAEPGREHGCHDDVYRQRAPRDRVVAGGLDAQRRPKANGDRDNPVDDDEPQ